MPEYHLLRAALGLAQTWLCLSLVRHRIRTAPAFVTFLSVEAGCNLIPMYVWSAQAWRAWAWLAGLRMLTVLVASMGLFSFGQEIAIGTRLVAIPPYAAQVFGSERRMLAAFSSSLALALIVSGWRWAPENGFQAFGAVRQYFLLGLAAAVSCAWCWATTLRPVELSRAIKEHGLIWCGWLWVAFAMAATVKGGLAWTIWPWNGNLDVWRAISDGAMLSQIGLVLLWMRRSSSRSDRSRRTSPSSRAMSACSRSA